MDRSQAQADFSGRSLDPMHPLEGMPASPILTSAHKIGIVGLGLIGGSIAQKLVEQGRFVVAYNPSDSYYSQAKALGIRCLSSLEELAQGKPDIVIVATPLKAIEDTLAQLRPHLSPATTVMDVGSVKGPVRRMVQEAGLAGQYVGAHPMTGNEHSGFAASESALFDDALWALSVDHHTDYSRFLTVADMVTQGLGNRLIVLDDQTHDACAALISHMPHVVATALAKLLVAAPDRQIAAALAAGSWRDMTRVALTDPERTQAMVEENASQVADLLDTVSQSLAQTAEQLRQVSDDEKARAALTAFFQAAQPYRDYRQSLASSCMAQAASSDIAIDPNHWQQDLIHSARRGEQLVALTSTNSGQVVSYPQL